MQGLLHLFHTYIYCVYSCPKNNAEGIPQKRINLNNCYSKGILFYMKKKYSPSNIYEERVNVFMKKAKYLNCKLLKWNEISIYITSFKFWSECFNISRKSKENVYEDICFRFSRK